MTDDRDDHASDSTMNMIPAAGGTLDLPVEDRVAPGSALDPGKLIGRFVIRSRLGEGGMGVVLSGMDPDLGRPVAIKVVKEHADHPGYRARLMREAQVMARLEHPNVLRVYEVGTDRGRLYLAMEFVDGVTLTNWLAVQRRPWREIVAMFAQVGAGLSAVHRNGLVHRDFKPDNVLVDRDGRARVSDFGLARIDPDLRETNTPNLGASLTKTGMLVGTPAYMAPEQYYGSDVDARADQYSFCVALREALTGKRVCKVDDPAWGAVPRAVRDVVDCGASVDLDERFASMDEMLEALQSAQRRTALVLGIAAGAAVLAVAIVATVVLLSRQDETRRAVDQPTVVDGAIASTPIDAAIASVPLDATIASSPVDAAIANVVAPPPPDAAVVALAADAAVVVDVPDKRTERTPTPKPKPTSSETTVINGVTITPVAPLAQTDAAKKHNIEGDKPKRHEMVAAHKAAVRTAVTPFGFGGLTFTGTDRDGDFADHEARLAAATDDLTRGVAMYAMGQVERLRGSCPAASKQWAAARPLLANVTNAPINTTEDQKHRNQAFQFLGRIWIAEGYCDLLGGRALGADEKLALGSKTLFGSTDAERAEAWFALGIAYWETGNTEEGKHQLVQAATHGSEKLRQAILAYANATGISL
jgi:predicted Ser/Thr protein kinase